MRDHNMGSWWSTCMLLVALYSLIINFLVLAFANSPSASLQQNQSVCHDQEKLALLQFKQSFLIDCPAASSSVFARPKLKSWRESSPNDHTSDCCWWDGVKCNEETGHVIGLDLSSSCLYGTFPPNNTLFSLHHLRELDLSDNYFNLSQIPSSISHLSKLTKLNLSYSAFIGQVPLGISNMFELRVLDLSNHNSALTLQEDQSFEKLVANLTRLTQLYLNFVDISSVVPVILSNFTSLQDLSLIRCNLFGSFPTDVLLLPKLEVLYLDSNINLKGYLPEFGTNRPLRILRLHDTSFNGELTPSIGYLGSLTELILSDSQFTGPIPASLGNLTKLTKLVLWCSFDGEFPLPITNVTQLSVLEVYGVHVKAQILNPWLLKLTKLESLALSNTSLQGEIPPALANLTRLNSLGLAFNQLTGPLPLWLGNVTKLSFLDLSGNHFQGPIIPHWFSQFTNLESLFLTSHGSVAMFKTLMNLPSLSTLALDGVNLIFPPDASTNSSYRSKFSILSLVSCNLKEFPQFLRYQDKLKLLDLQNNSIVGTIPRWFVNSTAKSLVILFLDDNHLTGFEEPLAFLPWNNLQYLHIQRNKLQGRLPSPPSSLEIYDVSQNQLSGVIPEQICKASSLTRLDLSDNNLSGRIPTCIGSQLGSSLLVLNLRGNSLQGSIPQTFTKSCQLEMINLSENQLEGPLPKSLSNCQVLEVIDVGNNRLNDTFPSWLGSLSHLRFLVMRHNKFHGRVTIQEFGDHHFSSLLIIDLSYNFFIGDLPSTLFQNWEAMRVTDEDKLEYSYSSNVVLSVSDSGIISTSKRSYPYSITITNKGSERLFSQILTGFREIDLSSNNFTGGIPDVLGSLKGLQALNLSNNNLVGDIPSSLSNIKDLEALDLSQNMLLGEIPQQLTELIFLEIFNVSHNRLVGRIPQGKQFNTFDDSSFVGNLGLCGVPLLNKCGNTDTRQPPPPPQSMTDDETKDFTLIDWIITSLGSVSGCIVGFIIGKIYITDKHHDWFMETFGRRRRPKPRARMSVQNRRRNL